MDYDAETAWIYNQRLAYRTIDDIAVMATRPPIRDDAGRFSAEGGLGRRISRSTVKRRLLEAAQAHSEDLAELVPEYRAVSLARLDEQSRVATAQITRLLARAGYVWDQGLDWESIVIDVHAEKLLQGALKTLGWIEERRAKLLGLDAPVEVSVQVEHFDAEAEELKAMLDEAAGDAPKKRKKARA
jgi:hypothetical protein